MKLGTSGSVVLHTLHDGSAQHVKAAAMGKAILLYQNHVSDEAPKPFTLPPLFAAFPILCLACVFVADVASIYTLAPFWMTASAWFLAIGLGTAAALALAEAVHHRGGHHRGGWGAGWAYLIGCGAAATLALVNLALRLSAPTIVVTEAEMALSTIVFLIVLVTGLVRGELAFINKPSQP